ncbi:hypothetical protein NDA11_004216 [Ustilago hordei]|nr:hypothetical protein NDA10_007490 [Ustilago hordei]KAJ1576673.1 hypothetical protein NDA11_004216 [Ustilago hordei]
MAHSQHGIDGILPIFMGNLNQPFVTPTGTQDDAATSIEMHAACYMTYVAWEAKNRDKLQPGAGSGVTNKHTYPCLDVLKIRASFKQNLTTLAMIPTFEKFNVVSNLIWNDHVQPALPSISATGVSNPPPSAAAAAAAATDDDNGMAQCKKQHMDLG